MTFYFNWRINKNNNIFADKICQLRLVINLPWGCVSCQSEFKPNWFSRFKVYQRQTNTKTKKICLDRKYALRSLKHWNVCERLKFIFSILYQYFNPELTWDPRSNLNRGFSLSISQSLITISDAQERKTFGRYLFHSRFCIGVSCPGYRIRNSEEYLK